MPESRLQRARESYQPEPNLRELVEAWSREHMVPTSEIRTDPVTGLSYLVPLPMTFEINPYFR